jgi:FMN phosphatase YigB (HAD superfamily)
MGVGPDETIFVDDNADNIEAAAAFGMNTVHFIDPLSALEQIDKLL